MKTKAEQDREWREGDRLITASETAALMNLPIGTFNYIDGSTHPTGWPRCYRLSSHARRYSYLDAKDYANAQQFNASEAELRLLGINPDYCDLATVEYAGNICDKATRMAGCIETLKRCVEDGPIEEASLPSKYDRETLAAFGLIHPILNKGVGGWWAASYAGKVVLSVMEHRREKS